MKCVSGCLLAMVLFSLPQLNEDQGSATADGFRNAANLAANFACGLWQNYAGATAGFPDPTGIGGFNNGLYSNLCTPRGFVPPIPQVPFDGGQCEILYDVDVEFGSARGGVPNGTVPPPGTATYLRVPGKIRRAYVRSNPGGIGQQGIFECGVDSERPDGVVVVWSSSDADPSRYEGAFVEILEVTPSIPGEEDNCGDPHPEFDKENPPPDSLTKNDTLVFGGFTVPVTLNYVPVKIAPNINIRPEFNVDVGGLTVNFKPEGIDVYFKPDINFPDVNFPPQADTRPNPPQPRPPFNPNQDLDLSEVLDELEDIKKCACGSSFDLEVESFSSRGDGVFNVPSDILYVDVNFTDIGAGVRSQSGGSAGIDVYHIGWYSFGSSGKTGERVPLSFESNRIFPSTSGLTSFSFTGVFGSIADVDVYWKKPKAG